MIRDYSGVQTMKLIPPPQKNYTDLQTPLSQCKSMRKMFFVHVTNKEVLIIKFDNNNVLLQRPDHFLER